MGNHYVPRKYLRGFCEPGSDTMLWLYDKQLNQFRRASVGTVANERGFYSQTVEDELARLIENPGNVAIDKLRAGINIDATDREHVAIYIATMFKRVPHYRQQAAASLLGVLADTVREVKGLISRAAAEGAIDQSVMARRLAEADAYEKEFENGPPPPDVEEAIRTPWPALLMVQLVWSMAWRFVSAGGPSYFLTSDNPAFFFAGFGLTNLEAELTFPLSSTLALHGSWQLTDHRAITPIPEYMVQEFNRRVACGATRFIFYRERKDWIASLAKRSDQSSLSRIHWDSGY